MNTILALLRGINVSGKNQISMADLRSLFLSLGFEDVQTYLQSGNVVFRCDDGNLAELADRIQTGISQGLGLDLPVILLLADDLARISNSNPFIAENGSNDEGLHVTFLKSRPDPSLVNALAVPPGETDEFRISGSEIYLRCPNGYGRTKLNNTFFERKLNVPATTRNWRTVLALVDMAS